MTRSRKRVGSAVAALGLFVGVVVLTASPSSAGGPEGFFVDVTGEAECLSTGEVQVTWTAVIDIQTNPGTTIVLPPPDLEIEGMRPTGAGQAVVQFDGEQSGALTGAVTFDPFQQTIVASNESFPVSSQAVAVGTAPEGGTVDLAVDVLVFDPSNPEQNNFTVFGEGSVNLPACAQPIVTASASPAAETRPRFTG